MKTSNGDNSFTHREQEIDLPGHNNMSIGDQSIYIGDINGDGTSDLILTNNSMSKYISLKNDGFGSFSIVEFYGFAENEEKTSCLQGDFNGDGITDFVTIKDNCTTHNYAFDISLKIGKSNGLLHTNPMIIINDRETSITKAPLKSTTGDFNGDGLTDIWLTTRSHYLLCLSNGDGTFTKNNYIVGNSFYDNMVISSDFTGDGITDIYANKVLKELSEKSDILQSVSNKISGGRIEVDYKYPKDFSQAIKPENNSITEHTDSSPRLLVKSVNYFDGIGKSFSKSYDYINGMSLTGKRPDRKSLGFEKVKKINPDGSYEQTHFHMGNNLTEKYIYSGIPIRNQQYGSNSVLYSEQIFEYDHTSQTYSGRKVWFPHLKYSWVGDYNGDISEHINESIYLKT